MSESDHLPSGTQVQPVQNQPQCSRAVAHLGRLCQPTTQACLVHSESVGRLCEAPSSSLQPGASLPSPLLLSSPGFSTKSQHCPHSLCLVPLLSLVCPSLGLQSRLPEIHSQGGDFLLFAISPLPRGEKWNIR